VQASDDNDNSNPYQDPEVLNRSSKKLGSSKLHPSVNGNSGLASSGAVEQSYTDYPDVASLDPDNDSSEDVDSLGRNTIPQGPESEGDIGSRRSRGVFVIYPHVELSNSGVLTSAQPFQQNFANLSLGSPATAPVQMMMPQYIQAQPMLGPPHNAPNMMQNMGPPVPQMAAGLPRPMGQPITLMNGQPSQMLMPIPQPDQQQQQPNGFLIQQNAQPNGFARGLQLMPGTVQMGNQPQQMHMNPQETQYQQANQSGPPLMLVSQPQPMSFPVLQPAVSWGGPSQSQFGPPNGQQLVYPIMQNAPQPFMPGPPQNFVPQQQPAYDPQQQLQPQQVQS